MSLRALHRRANRWIQRPIGQLASLLLLVAMIMGAVPPGQIHAHADSGHDHEHALLAVGGTPDHGDPSGIAEPLPADPTESFVLHAHDVLTPVPALAAVAALTLHFNVPETPSTVVLAPAPPSSARIPPHRPPIA